MHPTVHAVTWHRRGVTVRRAASARGIGNAVVNAAVTAMVPAANNMDIFFMIIFLFLNELKVTEINNGGISVHVILTCCFSFFKLPL